MIIETAYDPAKRQTVSRDTRWPDEWLTAAEVSKRTGAGNVTHISPLVPGQPGRTAEKVATDLGIGIKPITYDGDVQGYIINGKRTNGVACNTAVFSDSTSPADQLLFALIKELQNG